jgi:hypothetical protein
MHEEENRTQYQEVELKELYLDSLGCDEFLGFSEQTVGIPVDFLKEGTKCSKNEGALP